MGEIYHACVIFQDVTSFMLSTDALIDMLARLGAQVRLTVKVRAAA